MLFLEYFSGMVKCRGKPDTSGGCVWSALYHLHMESSMTWDVRPSCVYAVTLACPQHAGLAAHAVRCPAHAQSAQCTPVTLDSAFI